MRHIGALTVLLVAATLTGCDSGDGTDGENRPTASTTASTSAEPSVALTPQQARSTLLVRANLGARWKKEAPWSFLPGCTDLPESPLLMLPVAAQAEIAWTLPEGPKVEQLVRSYADEETAVKALEEIGTAIDGCRDVDIRYRGKETWRLKVTPTKNINGVPVGAQRGYVAVGTITGAHAGDVGNTVTYFRRGSTIVRVMTLSPIPLATVHNEITRIAYQRLSAVITGGQPPTESVPLLS